mmetsp:Transcript_108894/g.338258  ORF Transcript_108894/g.338258 Transcript_108894/m.338258 type:complete len:263 (-) Transcript_108894:685-1473(-)
MRKLCRTSSLVPLFCSWYNNSVAMPSCLILSVTACASITDTHTTRACCPRSSLPRSSCSMCGQTSHGGSRCTETTGSRMCVGRCTMRTRWRLSFSSRGPGVADANSTPRGALSQTSWRERGSDLFRTDGSRKPLSMRRSLNGTHARDGVERCGSSTCDSSSTSSHSRPCMALKWSRSVCLFCSGRCCPYLSENSLHQPVCRSASRSLWTIIWRFCLARNSPRRSSACSCSESSASICSTTPLQTPGSSCRISTPQPDRARLL